MYLCGQKSFQEPISVEFQRKYANAVLQLEDLNKELNECLIGVQQYCQEVYTSFYPTVLTDLSPLLSARDFSVNP